MKKLCWLLLVAILACVVLYPFQPAVVFTETKTASPNVYMLPLLHGDDFALRYTHSIHLSDVTEYYTVEEARIRMQYMTYTDTAIGMPATAEEGQTLTFKDGIYTLAFSESFLRDFTLYVGDIDLDLALLYNGRDIALKDTLTRGHSYRVSVERVSLYETIKGVTLQ